MGGGGPGQGDFRLHLRPIHTVDMDYQAALEVAQLHRDGVPFGIGAAIHVTRHLPVWGADALVATVAPKAYEGCSIRVFDLNR